MVGCPEVQPYEDLSTWIKSGWIPKIDKSILTRYLQIQYARDHSRKSTTHKLRSIYRNHSMELVVGIEITSIGAIFRALRKPLYLPPWII